SEKLRPGTGAVDEGVVVRHDAVAPQADHAGVMGAEILAVGHVAAVAEGQVNVPGIEHDTAAEVAAAVDLWLGDEQHLDVFEHVAGQGGAGEFGAVTGEIAGRIAQVDLPVVREVRTDRKSTRLNSSHATITY